MTKQELEKAIEKGESVWVPYNDKDFRFPDYNNLLELCKDNTVKIVFSDGSSFPIGSFKISENGVSIRLPDNEFNRNYFMSTEVDVITTKAEAEHYLHHANVTRTETLPFLTWEEFLEEKELFFTNKSGYPMCLCIVDTKLGKKIGLGGANGYFDLQQIWDLTEANFYKAYDECVRLFRGE